MKRKDSARLNQRQGALVWTSESSLRAERLLWQVLVLSRHDLLQEVPFSFDPRFSHRTRTNDGLSLLTPLSDMLAWRQAMRAQARALGTGLQETLLLARRIGRA